MPQLRYDLVVITAASTTLRNLVSLVHKHKINAQIGTLNKQMMHPLRRHYKNEMVILLKIDFTYSTYNPIIFGSQLIL